MKKLVSLLLAALLCLSLCACAASGSGSDVTTATDKGTTAADTTDEAGAADDGGEAVISTNDEYVELLLSERTSFEAKEDDLFSYLVHTLYDAPEKGYVTIKDYKGNDETVIIPDTLSGFPVIALNSTAFEGCYGVSDIRFPDTLREVSFIDFSGNEREHMLSDTQWFKNLPDGPYYAGKVLIGYKGAIPYGTTLEIREGTVSVANAALLQDGNENISSVIFPDSIRYLSEYSLSGVGFEEVTVKKEWQYFKGAFIHCNALKKVTLEEGVTTVSTSAFAGCKALCRIDFSETLVTIENSAFMECASLADIKMPDSLRTIGERAFFESGLSSVELNDGLSYVKAGAFGDCESLTTLFVPKSVDTICEYAFGYVGYFSNMKRNDSFTLYVEEDSEALRYAEDNGIKHEIMKLY